MTKPDRQAFRNALVAALNDAGISQSELARRLGWDPKARRGTVARWFRDEDPSAPDLETIMMIAEVLDVPAPVLTHHLGYVPATDEHITLTSPEDAILADGDLDADAKTAILHIIRQYRR
jgi:transcriptional regulator with XRE-family HTH domain